MRVDNMEVAVGLHVRQCEARGRRLSQKPENRAFVARFWERRVKRWCGVMLRGGGVCVDDMEAAVGLRVRQREAGGGG